jgi:hypothetical protein
MTVTSLCFHTTINLPSEEGIVKNKWSVSGLALVLIISGASLAFSKNKNENKAGGDKESEVLPPTCPEFTRQEVVLIGSWYRRGKGLPPGLAKKQQLPPGLAQQLRKGGTLPPGLLRAAEPLPVVIEKQLYVLPTGYRRVVIAGNIVIMNEKTALIYDVMRLVIP